MRSLLSLTFLLLLGAPTFAQSQKIGHVDKNQMMLMLPSRKAAEEKVRRKAEELDARIKAMMAEYEKAVAETTSKYKEMTQVEQAMAQRDIRQLEDRIRTAQEQAEDDLEMLEKDLLAPMLKQVQDAIRDVAASNGYAYVVDASMGTVLFHADSDDLTPLVKAKLGI